MTTIAEEIRTFIANTGTKQVVLSRESGVPCPTINMLIKGKRKNLIGYNQDSIRAAMKRIEAAIAKESDEEASHAVQ